VGRPKVGRECGRESGVDGRLPRTRRESWVKVAGREASVQLLLVRQCDALKSTWRAARAESCVLLPAPLPSSARKAAWRGIFRFGFVFSDDETEDADIRLLLLEAYDGKYAASSAFRTVFDILLHAMEGETLPVPLARRLADRCLR